MCRSQQAGAHSAEARDGLPEAERLLKGGKQSARPTSSSPRGAGKTGLKPFQTAACRRLKSSVCLSVLFTPVLPGSVVTLSLTRH